MTQKTGVMVFNHNIEGHLIKMDVLEREREGGEEKGKGERGKEKVKILFIFTACFQLPLQSVDLVFIFANEVLLHARMYNGHEEVG